MKDIVSFIKNLRKKKSGDFMENKSFKEPQLSASILNANKIELHSKIVELDGLLDYIHIDVMDGVFVPNKTDGIDMFKNAKRTENKPLDVHLMVENPIQVISNFDGASIISFHIETIINSKSMTLDMNKFYELAYEIKYMGAQVGVAIKPNTSVSLLRNILNKIDVVVVMTVEPGYGGQKLIESTLEKIEKIREMGYTKSIEVDGGITCQNAIEPIKRGADIIVAGTALFDADDIYDAGWQIKQK